MDLKSFSGKLKMYVENSDARKERRDGGREKDFFDYKNCNTMEKSLITTGEITLRRVLGEDFLYLQWSWERIKRVCET